MSKRALIRVDIQNDFVTGSLAVADAASIIPLANQLAASSLYKVVVDTQCWHPADHSSFAANHSGRKPFDVIDLFDLRQVLWPVHCVQNTRGAEFDSRLDRTHVSQVIRKGMHRDVDGYSGFFENDRRASTPLKSYLAEHGITEVDVLGLALNYCASFTALDAESEGFATRVIRDACRTIGDENMALKELLAAGIALVTCQSVLDGPSQT